MTESPVSRTPTASLYRDDSTRIEIRHSTQILPVMEMESGHSYQHESDTIEFEIAGYGLWLRDETDRYLDEVLAEDHWKTFHSCFPDVVPMAGTVQTQSDRASSTDSAVPSPNTRICPQSPGQLGRKRKACSQNSRRSIKRTKAKALSAILNEEVVFLRLEKVFMTIEMDTNEFHWAKRSSSWTTVDQEIVDIGWLFEDFSRKFLSVEVRPDGIGYIVKLSWNDKEQCFAGEAVDGKMITVLSEVMKAMHMNPLRGQFIGRRRDI